MIERYARQLVLKDIGFDGQSKLADSGVLIAGIGGIGSLVLMQLAGMGVGRIKVVDRDVVTMTDLHRQLVFTEEDVGHLKVESAERRVKSMNSDVKVEPHATSLDDATARELVEGCDVVIDCLDSTGPRLSLSRACFTSGIPYVHGSAIEMFGQVGTFLAGKTSCYGCLVSEFESGGRSDSCARVGVSPAVLGVVASIQVDETVRLITGREPAYPGSLLFIDLRYAAFERVELKRNPHCRVCGPESSDNQYRARSYEEACARDGRGTYFMEPKRGQTFDIDRFAENAKKNSINFERIGNLIRIQTVSGRTVNLRKDGGAIVAVQERVFDAKSLRRELESEYNRLLSLG